MKTRSPLFFVQSSCRRILTALFLAPLACGAGEVLHNGIALPDQWPPRPATFARDLPLVPPYLANPPEVIPIDVGRQILEAVEKMKATV